MLQRIFLVTLLACACGDDDDTTTPMDGSMGSDTGSASGLCDSDPILDNVDGTPAFAVLGSDFSSTSIGLLGSDGTVLADAWLDSSTTAPGLTAALSGDVTFPTQSVDGSLISVDRFGVDVISRFCHNGALVGQVRLSPMGESFSSNPQDFVMVDDSTAWATRYEHNPDSGADPLDQGTDLIGINPQTMETNGERIDLSGLNGTVTGLGSDMNEVDVDILARPGRMVVRGDYLVIGLEMLPANFFGDSRGHGEGQVAIVDLADNSMSTHTLSGMANCGQVVSVPSTTDEVIVSCRGYSDVSFSDIDGVRDTAGLVRLRVGASVTEVSSWRASSDMNSAIAVWNLIATGGDEVVAIEQAEVDRAMRIDLGAATQTLIAESDAYSLGQGAMNGDTLLLPDAAAGSVRRFTLGASVEEGEAISIGPAALPPRFVQTM